VIERGSVEGRGTLQGGSGHQRRHQSQRPGRRTCDGDGGGRGPSESQPRFYSDARSPRARNWHLARMRDRRVRIRACLTWSFADHSRPALWTHDARVGQAEHGREATSPRAPAAFAVPLASATFIVRPLGATGARLASGTHQERIASSVASGVAPLGRERQPRSRGRDDRVSGDPVTASRQCSSRGRRIREIVCAMCVRGGWAAATIWAVAG
jgi:hypothetical protein